MRLKHKASTCTAEQTMYAFKDNSSVPGRTVRAQNSLPLSAPCTNRSEGGVQQYYSRILILHSMNRPSWIVTDCSKGVAWYSSLLIHVDEEHKRMRVTRHYKHQATQADRVSPSTFFSSDIFFDNSIRISVYPTSEHSAGRTLVVSPDSPQSTPPR